MEFNQYSESKIEHDSSIVVAVEQRIEYEAPMLRSHRVSRLRNHIMMIEDGDTELI